MSQNSDPVDATELSPVKRALLEIRQLRGELEQTRNAQTEPIAIVGMSLRLPGGVNTPEGFWQALSTGEDLISKVPADRWDANEYLNADADHAGTMYDAHGGFVSGIDEFDAEFFGINAREASSMDPQHRLLLELSWEALERASINPKSLANTTSGVFLGMSGSDCGRQSMRDARDIHAYSAVGSALSIAAGRISYFLNLRGPSLVIDTACSSSLVATHLACDSLRRSEINLAIVGGSNLIVSPDFNISFARTRMLAPDGHCKTFDSAADGYVRAEGCCVIILKRLSDAKQNGDRILACIAGSAVNQDGRSAGITAPNGPSQESVIRTALQNSGIDPRSVSYVEAHGTGTPLGDPIEIQALGSVYGSARSEEDPLYVGSVKTNLGHTEAVAGLVGLAKIVLMMQPEHGIPPNLHFRNPNPKIDFTSLRVAVPTALLNWPEADMPKYAGVSSFGFSGTNAHLILSSTPPTLASDPSPHGQEAVLQVSASNDVSLHSLVKLYVRFLETTTENFNDICLSARVGRALLSHQLSIRSISAKSAAILLRRWLSGETVPEITRSSPESPLIARNSISHTSAGMRRVELPTYPFQKTKFWFELSPELKRMQDREVVWKSAVTSATRQSKSGPLGWKIDSYPEKWELMHRLTLAYAQNTLIGAGVFRGAERRNVDEVIQATGFRPIYRNLVGRWLSGLAEEGILRENDGKFERTPNFKTIPVDEYWKRTEQLLKDDPGVLAYLRQCGKVIGDVMTGTTSALETLFPDGSFSITEGLYETGLIARYFNSIAASAVAETAARIGVRRNARILEIGGGTGGTTSAILPLLRADQVEYWFTDLSELFLQKARNKFSRYSFLHFAVFDLDRKLEEQGMGSSEFDLIVAANVVHASRNLDAALKQIDQLLAPGGVLVLLESTKHHSWFDMTTGLIEGWQHFEDDRTDNPLLDPDQWKKVLQRNGFNEVEVFPAAELPTNVLGQHVLLVRSPKVSSQKNQNDSVQHKPAKWKPQGTMASTACCAVPTVNFVVTLQGLAVAERQTAMLDFVRATICQVFQLSIRPEELGIRDRLSDLGMDSLIALELRAELAKGLGSGVQISSTIAFDTGTVGELSNGLLLSIERLSSSETIEESLQASSLRAVPTSVTAEQLSEMTEEEVEKLLNERLTRR